MQTEHQELFPGAFYKDFYNPDSLNFLLMDSVTWWNGFFNNDKTKNTIKKHINIKASCLTLLQETPAIPCLNPSMA